MRKIGRVTKGGGGWGVRSEKLGGGVRPTYQNPHPVCDQNMRFFCYPIYDLTKNLIAFG